MKKSLSLFLIFVLIFSLIGCTNAKKTGEKAVLNAQAELKITENWNKYLEINEIRYSAVKWAAEYIEDFCESPDIISARRALAASEAAYATLSELEIPEFTITSDDIDKALASGVDVSFLEMEFSSLELDLAVASALWESISRNIIYEGYWSYGMEYLEKTAETQLEISEINTEYLRITTNYLMLLLGKDSFDENMVKTYPTIFGKNKPFITSLSEAEEAATDCLDNLEEASSSYSELTGIQTANQHILEEAVKSGDYSEIFEKALTWGEKIFVIPCPSWDAIPDVLSYRSSGDEKIIWTSVGDNLDDVPEGLLLKYENVSKKELKQYVSYLEKIYGYGISVTGNYDDSAPFKLIYADGKNEFAITWDNADVTMMITQDTTCFCPAWYINYLLSIN